MLLLNSTEQLENLKFFAFLDGSKYAMKLAKIELKF